jgi:hypothetical protein
MARTSETQARDRMRGAGDIGLVDRLALPHTLGEGQTGHIA